MVVKWEAEERATGGLEKTLAQWEARSVLGHRSESDTIGVSLTRSHETLQYRIGQGRVGRL